MQLNHSDVRWAFFDILGRDPRNPEACDWHLSVSRGCPFELKRLVRRSTEAQSRNCISPSQNTFCIYRPTRPKVLVLGNCQAPNIARCLASATDVSVLGIEVMLYSSEQKLFAQLIEDANYIVTPELSEVFGSIGFEVIKKAHSSQKVIISYSPFYFTAEHPDIAYWGSRGRRVSSPVGDYHSRIALRSFLEGLSVAECINRFNADAFFEMGYFDAFDNSLIETIRREQDCDVKIGDYLEAKFGEERLSLSVNHPTSSLFIEFSRRILLATGLEAAPVCIGAFPNSLLANVIWPLHPLLVERFQMKIDSSTSYFRSGVMIDHDEFIDRSYENYSSCGAEMLLQGATPDQRAYVLGRDHPLARR